MNAIHKQYSCRGHYSRGNLLHQTLLKHGPSMITILNY